MMIDEIDDVHGIFRTTSQPVLRTTMYLPMPQKKRI